MPVAAQIRAQIEAALAQRIPSALTPQPHAVRPTASTGIPAVNDLLNGGLPIGAISEIVGPECSGRTTLALSFLATTISQGKVCAWIDVSDVLHPESAAAAGINLDRLLWVRCGNTVQPNNEINSATQNEAKAPQTTRLHLGGNSPHPRSEITGLPTAIHDLLNIKPKYKRNRIVGTPGAPNRQLSSTTSEHHQKEQIATDRLPARRGSYVLEQREAYEPRCAEPLHKPRPQIKQIEPLAIEPRFRKPAISPARKPWSRLDQALRVTDLLLQAGGFSAIVLDMGSIAPEFASRVPLATWFRYRAAAERTQSSFVILTQYPCAKSSAGAVLRLYPARPLESGTTVFAGLNNSIELSRRRFEQESNVISIRKPPQRESNVQWESQTPWVGKR